MRASYSSDVADAEQRDGRPRELLGSITADCHFEPVQFFFYLMEGVIADFAVRPHGEYGLPCCLQGAAAEFAVCRRLGVRSMRMRLSFGQLHGELLSDDLCDWRLVSGDAGEPCLQGAFPRGLQFAADWIAVMQVQRTQQRLEREALYD